MLDIMFFLPVGPTHIQMSVRAYILRLSDSGHPPGKLPRSCNSNKTICSASAFALWLCSMPTFFSLGRHLLWFRGKGEMGSRCQLAIDENRGLFPF